MINKQLKLSLILLCTFALLALLAPTVQAAESILPDCVTEGYCTLCDVMELVINFGKFLLGIVGSLALLMFVYGGFTWLTSGGESGKIDAGKKILINSVIGIAITFFAYIIVVFVVNALTASSGWKWDAKLTCTPLAPLEPPKVEDRGGPGGGETQGKKLGETCAKTNECETTLYCDKATTKCATKIATTQRPVGTPIDYIPPGSVKCLGMEIEDNDNLACTSGKCCTTSVGGLLCGPKDYCTVSTDAGGGENCSASKPCQEGLYCYKVNAGDTSGTCQRKKDKNTPCYSYNIIGGDVDDICLSGNCDRSVCIAKEGEALLNDICTWTSDCKNHCGATSNAAELQTCLFCWEYAYGTSSDGRGRCITALDKDQPCEDSVLLYCLGGSGCNNGPAPCKLGLVCDPEISFKTSTCIVGE